MAKVFIIILQYNNSQDTIKCLESVKELNWRDFEVIVVDNASEIQHLNSIRLFVESQESIGERRFGLIMNENNLGYAAGNNVGIKHALQKGADFVLILNPDTTVGRNLLKKLVKAAEEKQTVGIAGPAIREGNKVTYSGEIKWLKPELEHSSLKPLPRRQAGKTHDVRPKLLAKEDNLKPNQYIPGSVMLIKKEVFEKVGGFDERYFLYFEDADFCVRAQRAGFKLAVVPDVLVRHNPSSSTSALGSALLLRYHYRNAHLFNAKNAPQWVRISLPFWSLWIIIKQAVKILLRMNVPISRAILSGVLDFYKGRFGKIVLDTNTRIRNE